MCQFESERYCGSLVAFVFALVGLILAGCVPIAQEENGTPQRFSCARFGFSHWREFDLGLDSSPDDLLAIVNRLYEINSEQLHVETYPGGEIQKIHWMDNDVDYFAQFSASEQLMNIEVQWDLGQPTLVQVVDCLGPPSVEDETSESETATYWADAVVGESPYPGYVTILIVTGISSHSSELPLQETQHEKRVKQLSVMATLIPQQIIETPAPFPCAKFSVSHWQKFRFGVDALDDVIATVVTLWDIDENQIDAGETADGKRDMIRWSDAAEESHYNALVVKGRRLDLIGISFLPAPTLGQVIDCLGPPDYYIANGGPRAEATHLQIWYVEQGFVVTGHLVHSVLWQKALKAIPPGFGMNSFHILPAGVEQMTRRFDYTDEDGNPIMCIFKPWPGSVEAIEISAEPFFACFHSDTD